MSGDSTKAAPPGCRPEELLRRARQGDRVALGGLLEHHRSRMRAVALRICRSSADAEDAVQEASILVLQKLGQQREDTAFSAWLHRVTLNAALVVLRQRRQEEAGALAECPRTFGTPGAADPADPAVLPDELCEQRRRLRAVAAAAQRVNPIMMKTLELRELNGMDGAQVARHLGVSIEVVKTRVHRARAALYDLVLAATPRG